MPKKEIQKAENPNFERILVENFVSLQKVMTNLSIKFDDLSRQISKLLELFEISARTIAEKRIGLNDSGSREIAEKISSIAEQNKTIARGLSLLHESRTPQRMQPPPMRPPQKNWQQQRPPNPTAQSSEENNENESGEYTKSKSPYKEDENNV